MSNRPNVVVFYADDLGYGDVGCYGGVSGVTPNLDALAASGVRCTEWYSNSPVCSPSRAALLTGKHPRNAGVTSVLGGARDTAGLPADQATMASHLRGAGYATGIFGKWHLGVAPEHRPNAHGFDEFFGFLAGCVDYYSHIFYWGAYDGRDPTHDLWHNDAEVWKNGEYFTELVTRYAVEFVERHADEPFFCYVPYSAPHYPMHAPQHYLDRFDGVPADRRVLAAMIAAMDDSVGAILNALDRTGRREDTIVVFSSDNGPSNESRNWLDGTPDRYYGGSAGALRGHKGSLFDGGIREPFLISYPRGLPAGRTCAELGQMSDVLPTVLALADLPSATGGTGTGATAVHDVDGMDVSAMLRGEATPHGRAYWEYAGQVAVREGDWKLVLHGRPDIEATSEVPVHLANIAEDPGERTNLAEAQPEVAARLVDAAVGWRSGLRHAG